MGKNLVKERCDAPDLLHQRKSQENLTRFAKTENYCKIASLQCEKIDN